MANKTHAMHGRDHRLIGGDPVPVVFHIKVFTDTTSVAVGDSAREFFVARDMNASRIMEAHAGVTTVSTSGIVTVQLRNVTQGITLLSTAITIDANEYTSYTAATPSVCLLQMVLVGDKIAIDVTVAGTGAKGLEMILTFGNKADP